MNWNLRHASALPDDTTAFRPSVAVGNVVFASGCTGDRVGEDAPARVEDQVDLALDSVRRSLEAVGSRLDNVVKTFVLITRLDDYGSVRKAETEYYERHAPQLVTTPPAATLMVVPTVGRSELLVQIEVVAVLDRDMPGWQVTYHPEHWAGRELAYPHVPKEHAKFARSQSIGNLLVVSGCQALDHQTLKVETADVAEQSRIVLDKVRTALDDVGAPLANLVKTNVFVKEAGALATYREAERAYLREHAPELADAPPASSAFVMSELPRPEFLVEVEAFAVVDADQPGWEVRRQLGTRDAAESATAGRLVFLSACSGVSEGGSAPPSSAGEVATALYVLRDALARAGGDIGNVVKLTVMLRDADDYPAIESALLGYYREHAPGLLETPPATTFAQLPTIEPGGARLQVDAVAIR